MLKQRKNKKFSYKPRYTKDSLNRDRLSKDLESNKFTAKWQKERNTKQKKTKRGISLWMLILILVLLLICMYVLNFKFI